MSYKLEKVARSKTVNKSGGVMGRQSKLPTSRAVQVKRRKFLGGGADSSGFDPLDITGCQLWLKADALTGLDDGDDLPNSSATSWPDSSGEDNNGQEILDTPPSYKASVSHFGGKPAVYFAPTDGIRLAGNLQSDFWKEGGDDNDFTIFAVASTADKTINYQALIGAYAEDDWNLVSSNQQNMFVMGIDASDNMSVHGVAPASNVVTDASVDMNDDTAYIISTTYDFSSDTVYLWQNGALTNKSGSFTRGNGGMSNSPDTYIGAAASGTRGALANGWKGHIAEIIIYNSKLSEQNLWDVQLYLSDKYKMRKVLRQPTYH